jgi:hypothetical protein
MVKLFTFILLSVPTFLSSYGTSETNVGPSKKQSINFKGELEVHQGETFKVDNISIQDRYKQIPFYDCPSESFLGQAVANKETGKMEIQLKENPIDYAITKIDLEETEEIRVDHEPLYVFQQPKHLPAYFYHATIISKSSKTKHYSLISEHTKLECDEMNDAGHKEVPLSSVKSLKILGFSQRIDPEETKSKSKK